MKINEIYAQAKLMDTADVYKALDTAEINYGMIHGDGSDDAELFEAFIQVYNLILDRRGEL